MLNIVKCYWKGLKGWFVVLLYAKIKSLKAKRYMSEKDGYL